MKIFASTVLLVPLLLNAEEKAAPEFIITEAVICPEPPPGVKPQLREDEESGEKAPFLSLTIESLLCKSEWEEDHSECESCMYYTEEAHESGSALKDVKFSGVLIGADNRPLPVEQMSYTYSDGKLTINIENQHPHPLHMEYTLQGTLEYTYHTNVQRIWSSTHVILNGKYKKIRQVGGYQINFRRESSAPYRYILQLTAPEGESVHNIQHLIYEDKSGQIWRAESYEIEGEDAICMLYCNECTEKQLMMQLPIENGIVPTSGKIMIQKKAYGKGVKKTLRINQKIRLNGK